MKREVPQLAAKYTKNRIRRKLWQRVVSFLAAVVVFVTTYALVLPAMTLEKAPLCGKEEHIHDEACYTEVAGAKTLTCRLEEHTHEALCFQAPTTESVVPEPTVPEPTVPEPTVPEPTVPEPTVPQESELGASAPVSEAQAQPAAETPQQTIELGVPLDVEVSAGKTVKIPFTPEVTHEYIFTSQEPNNKEIYGFIYNENGRTLVGNSGSGGNNQFKIVYTLTAGVRYDLGVRYSSGSDSGIVPVLLSYGMHVYQQTDDGKYACTCGSVFESLSGSCGDAAYWTFEDGVLTIFGTGSMKNYGNREDVPWYPFRNLIKQVVVEEGVTTIAGYAFDGCTGLTSINIPESVTSIGNYTFSGCTGLTGINIPESVTSIGSSAFSGCTGLTSINIPESVTSIGGHAFYGCTGLTSINIPESMTGIGYGVFYGCTGLTAITLPSSLTTIDISAFYGCTGLTSINIPESVTRIGDSAFRGCTGLTSINIPESVTGIGNSAFDGCTGLTSINIPENVTSIGSSAFSGCTGLTSINIPENVTSIDSGVFYGCTGLTSINIPESVTSIGYAAFNGCTGLTAITLPSSLTTIDISAFNGCTGLTSINIPKGVTSIRRETFCGCIGLTSIDISENVTSIGYGAFLNCTGLTAITLPSSLTTIDSHAFSSCTGLTSINIPENVTSIGGDAFYDCTGLKTVYWNAAADVSVGVSDTNTTFWLVLAPNSKLTQAQLEPLVKSGCTGIDLPEEHYLILSALQSDFLEVPMTTLPESLYYVDAQGVLYRVDEAAGTAYLTCCPEGLTSYTVPAQLPEADGHGPVNVVGVDTYAFCQASALETLTFASPETVTELRDFAFYKCENLAAINTSTTDEAVLAHFPNAKTGVGLFENTKISHGNTAVGDGKIILKAEGMDVSITTKKGTSHTPSIAGDGTLLFYTGETAQTVISVSNPTDDTPQSGTVLRVYYWMETAEGELNFQPGTYTIPTNKGSEITMTVFKTAVPNCYCVELTHPAEGDTVSIILEGRYPSPASAGGAASVWGVILTKEQAEALGKNLPSIKQSYVISWETVRDSFPVTKDVLNSSSAKLGGNCKGGAYVTGLSYQIKMQREGDTLEGMGKDHMVSADFVDVLTLPEGMRLSKAAEDAIRNGTYTTKYEKTSSSYWYSFFLPDGSLLARIQKDNGSYEKPLSFGELSLHLSEDGYPVIRWTFRNPSFTAKEISNVQFTLQLANDCLEIPVVVEDRTYEIRNTVTVTQHFMHSGDTVQQDGCAITLTPSAGTLKLTKQMFDDGEYLGEPKAITITLQNPNVGTAPPAYRLEDPLPTEMYMTAEQMAQALLADRQLTIQITGATLCALLPDQTVTGMDGVTTGKPTQQNTGVGTRYNGQSGTDPAQLRTGATILLAWNESGQLTVTLEDGDPVVCDATGDAIQKVLDSWGYLVTKNAKYTLTWDLRVDGEPLTLVGGASIEKKVTANLKDTFMFLTADQTYSVWSSNIAYDGYNYAYVYYGKDGAQRIMAEAREGYRYCEFFLSKAWFMGGQPVKPDTKLGQGTVLDYRLTAEHKGTAHYDLLPLADHMIGAQALIVPVDLNENEAWAAGCPTVTLQDGSAYYILKTPGIYSRVWTSPSQMADTVAVTKTGSGLDTVIKWYFTDYGGSRTDTVKYHAMVCPQDVLPEGTKTFFLNNEAWLGDHESHRLYHTIPGWTGSTLSFDKKIVAQVGDDGGWSHSQIAEGSKVVYRLTVYGVADKNGEYWDMTLTGADLYDLLPKNVAGWCWDTDKVQIEYRNATVTNGESWSITEAQNNQQTLRWDSSFRMTFTRRADIYVTLQFPEGDVWVDYANAYGTTKLVNTFYMLGGQTSVTHDLSIPGEVWLQKGVYSSCYKESMGKQTDARWYYSNADDGNYQVTYYIVLYNGGRTNLYITEIQDRLPRGFTYSSTFGKTYYDNSSEVVTVYKDAKGTNATRRRVSYSPTLLKTENGVQYLNFRIEKSPYVKSVSYDKERGMYYLKPGEYFVFTYNASTNKEPDTDPEATNVVTMPYYNFNGGGVKLASPRIEVTDADKYRPNDGGCEIDNTDEAYSMGFTGGEGDTQWLTSQVTVRRGSIKPGITKKLVSATDGNGNVTQNPVSTSCDDTLKWQITIDNDGTATLKDYVVTDSMQAPYKFTGGVRYSIYDTTLRANIALFDSISWGEDTVTLVTSDHGSETVPVDGVYRDFSVRDSQNLLYTYFAAFSIDPDTGNAVMSLRFATDNLSIGPGCSAVLTLDTKNPDNTLTNQQFFNTAYITPLAQVWDHSVNKGNYTTYKTPYSDATDSVRNSAPVSTAFGYATSAVKSVEEALDPDNRATSTDDRNYIAVSDVANEFTYTLAVNNLNEQAMDQLLLIDRLPEVGDHTVFDENNPRDSEFKVSFAEKPNFAVIVTSQDGTETTLDPATYTLQFSDKTEFAEADWNGDDTGWESTIGTHRTVRLMINDPDGTLIPGQSRVSLRFNCKIDDPNAKPGQIAWNAFGYRYSMVGIDTSLSAAPLKVGVKMPTVPKLTKKLVDHRGAAMEAKENQTFSFLVYTGETLPDIWETADELKAALDTADRTYRVFSVSVSAGAAESEPLMLPENEDSADGWKWKRGQAYTVVELPAEGSDYGFRSFGVVMQNAYSFTYDPAVDQMITCSNNYLRWNIDLTKAEPASDGVSSGKPLEGAVFALYSMNPADKIAKVPANVAEKIEQDGTTWYLHSVETTGADGKIRWNDLRQARYYLVEIKAPNGYKLPKTNRRLLSREEESQGTLTLTIYNYPAGPELPAAGGMGTTIFYVIGLILLVGAAVLLVGTRRKKR